jgi:hypothetical protein
MRPFDNSIPPTSIGPNYKPDLVRPYIKLVVSIVVVIGIVLASFFFIIKGNSITQSAGTVSSICVCKACGTMIENPTGLDCEELLCPNCGHALSKGTVFGAGDPVNQKLVGNIPSPPANQNQPPLSNNVLTPLDLNQNQRETLAEQGNVAAPQFDQLPQVQEVEPQLAAAPVPRPNESRKCICPNCGTMVERGNGISCANIQCPACRSTMTNAIVVGTSRFGVEPQEPLLIGMRGGANLHPGAGFGASQPSNFSAGSNPLSNTPCPQAPAAPCPNPTHQHTMQAPIQNNSVGPSPAVGSPSLQQPDGFNYSNTQPITYSNTVAQIVQANCLRCHGGPIRNLSTYDNLKGYADNGLLMMMVQPGGPMSRFLSADEAQKIISWVKAGSPP